MIERLTFHYLNDVEDENRGFVVDRIDAYLDGEIVGYLKIENIPSEMFNEYYKSIFNYIIQIQGWGLGVAPLREKIHWRDLPECDLVKMLEYRTRQSASMFEGLLRKELLIQISKWEKTLLRDKVGDAFRRFKDFHVDKPFVAYIKVEPQYRRRGIATALYLAGAAWMRERGLEFRASSLQTDMAKSVWEKFKRQELAKEDNYGRLVLYAGSVS